MLDYVNHPDYMTVKNRKGLCFGISHTLEADEPENINGKNLSGKNTNSNSISMTKMSPTIKICLTSMNLDLIKILQSPKLKIMVYTPKKASI
jgi:hypothetical protein